MILQEQFDEAMFEFSSGHCDAALARLKAIVAEDPDYFDAQLALGAAYYAKGDYAAAIAEGHKAEKMKPRRNITACKPASPPGGGTWPLPERDPRRNPASKWRGPSRRPRRKNFPTCRGKRSRFLSMKSSYELAMERLGKTTPSVKLTDEKKRALAELDSKYAAKTAEREIFLKGELSAAVTKGDAEAYAQIEKQLVSTRKTLQAELEEKKEKVRNQK
jgi:tetratricopeptide (TPR) repeat protein